jgi:hypothetical protein
MSRICLVHLVRAQNGIGPFKKFIKSYLEYPGGIKHEFLILFKGFRNQDETCPYLLLLEGLHYQVFHVSDEGYDIGAYLKVAKHFDFEYFCFLNSFSVLLDSDWLKKMFTYISKQEVGLVGAMGSYESSYSNFKIKDYYNPSKFPLRKKINFFIEKSKIRVHFKPFPNYHIRTNAFIISKEIFNKIQVGDISTKEGVLRFESGRKGLTRQIMKMGLKVLVVGKDGKAYEKEDWIRSNTFRLSKQENLLVSDNQTLLYENFDQANRCKLSRYAWGNCENHFGSK